MEMASTFLSSRIRRKSVTVFGGDVCSDDVSASDLVRTLESTSQRYASVVFGPRAKERAWTMPRPLSPITATTTFSAGDPSKTNSGPMPRDAVSAPRPATEVFFRKSRRSIRSFGFMAFSQLQNANFDIPEIHLVDVVL